MSKFLSKVLLLLFLLPGIAACTLKAVESETSITVLQIQSATPLPDTPLPAPTTAETAAAQVTPLPTATASRTLRPPPTFEPPTLTVTASPTPSITPSPTVDLYISIPGLHGAETATPESTAGCTPREDWKLTYTVKFGDALSRIADQYGVYTSDLTLGNCLTDPNTIVEGQTLRVPGEAHPEQPKYECIPFQILTPFNGTNEVGATGNLVFNWIGPRVPKTLIRIYLPGKNQILDGSQIDLVVELRQNETINVAQVIPAGGTYTWELYPLDENFVQIDCAQGGPWSFTKPQSPDATATSMVNP